MSNEEKKKKKGFFRQKAEKKGMFGGHGTRQQQLDALERGENISPLRGKASD